LKRAVLAFLMGLALAAGAQPARLIIIRHAEKPEDDQNPHLSEAGQDRAGRLVKWLTAGKVLGTNGPPAALYAPKPTHQRESLRCEETLEPTAQALGLQVRAPYKAADFEALARDLRLDPSVRGKNVVVCWVHDFLPDLPAAFGAKKRSLKWRSDDFDSAYVITYPDGRAALQQTREQLKKK
jgi:hypothetical protein